jgi:hypothetical protein
MNHGANRVRRRAVSAPAPKGVLTGDREPIFSFLSEEVRTNMLRRDSESAVLWNAFYPFAHQGISLGDWERLRPLWGSAPEAGEDDLLTPYFWGLHADGSPLEGLADTASSIAGRNDRLEIDLILLGTRHLVAVEAKVGGEAGRCGRYASGRCPEVHGGGGTCRYWDDGPAAFDGVLDFGLRPERDQEARPPCATHYQLARTLLAVQHLARKKGLTPHFALLIPRRRWPAQEAGWLDFAERVRDEAQWRRLRVLAWEELEGLRRRIVGRV